MGKAVRSHVAALPLLEPIITDLAGGIERLLNVTRLHDVPRPIGSGLMIQPTGVRS